MANPQLENGFTEIANEILEELCKINLSGQEFRVCLFILRKTYGFKKKEDWVSLSQFSKGTGLKKQRICEALRSLEARSIITRKRNGDIQNVGFIKNYDRWKQLRKNVTLRKNVMSVTLKRNLPLRESVPTKETITKETITKETPENFLTIESILDSYFETLTERQRRRFKSLRHDFSLCCEQLLNNPDPDQRYTESEITTAVMFARNNSFWRGNFLYFTQLVETNSKGVKYIEIFLNQADKHGKKKLPPGNPTGEVEYASDI